MIRIEAPVSSSSTSEMGNYKYTVDNESASDQNFGNYVNYGIWIHDWKFEERKFAEQKAQEEAQAHAVDKKLVVVDSNCSFVVVGQIGAIDFDMGIVEWIFDCFMKLHIWPSMVWEMGYKFCHGSSWRYRESRQQCH